MARDMAVPECIAERLAQDAVRSIEEQLEDGYARNATAIADSASELIQASREANNGNLVGVSQRSVSKCAAFYNEDRDASDKAEKFLKNMGVW